jgi:transposase-like protein
MKGKRHSTEDKIRILRELDTGKTIGEICREKNISDVTFYRCKKQFGQIDLNDRPSHCLRMSTGSTPR